MAKMRFHYDDSQLKGRITGLEAKLGLAVDAIVQYHALKGMAYLKTDAPWSDRTGAARAGLHTSASKGAGQRVITFAHAVNYGIWLEVKYSGRDAVIMPTVLKTGGELMSALQNVMGRV